MMVGIRDEAALSGTPLSAEELSIKCLGESKTKNYIRGLGNGPKPSTYLSKSNSQSAARQDQLQKLQHELDLIREEQRREREDEKTQHEEEQRRHEEKYEEEKRRWEETQRRQDEERSILLKEMEGRRFNGVSCRMLVIDYED
ncbi:vicilin-like seed storage protein At2g18540 [Rhododendron vialii]|uniref:vicilin-like seed storage protein At2g18540 n=1 Tax=Rhododendron vialii TaxID=182163 RepID=UPI00265DE658|nr:vicilin-like seed storage protein At2g18540 [Rhododendron vialii]